MSEISNTPFAASLLQATMQKCMAMRHQFVMPEHMLSALLDDSVFLAVIDYYADTILLTDEMQKCLESFEQVPQGTDYSPEPSAQMEELDRSVRDYEPHLALYGGQDGLDFYRAIVKNYTPILKPGGYICFEFGMGQEADVCHILMEHGYELGRLARDSGERARAVLAQKPDREEE